MKKYTNKHKNNPGKTKQIISHIIKALIDMLEHILKQEKLGDSEIDKKMTKKL